MTQQRKNEIQKAFGNAMLQAGIMECVVVLRPADDPGTLLVNNISAGDPSPVMVGLKNSITQAIHELNIFEKLNKG